MQSIDDFARGTEHLEDRAHLAARLERGDRLRIKWGIDPTAPDIHLGHTVPMRRLRAWQEAGHLPVIVIGDWTARIGDPSGRSEIRPSLSASEVETNARTYLAQMFTILDRDRTEVRRQTGWYDPMTLEQVLHLCGARTVQQLLQRADFTERMGDGRAIGVHELLYALLQGYDSVAIDADVEIGGTDQLFNLLTAREVQRHYGKPPQDVATFPILEGTDGVRKMSKSYGNYIGVAEPPTEQYGKAMSIPDALIVRYLELATDVPAAEVERWCDALKHEGTNPRDAKAFLARAIVRQFHGEDAARRAEEQFQRVHAAGGLPDDMAEVAVSPGPYEALSIVKEAAEAAGTGLSGSDLRRQLAQGGVRHLPSGSETWSVVNPGEQVVVRPGDVLRIGKRIYIKLHEKTP
jgi:tyrosyl-tRNA synthetase